MYQDEAEEIYVCHVCVGEEFLKKLLKADGKRHSCDYCGKSRKSVPLMWLAEKIRHALDEHYYVTLEDSYNCCYGERAGEPVNDLIQEMAEIDTAIANDVQSYLSLNYGPNPMDFEEDPYGEEAYYSDKPAENWDHQESWRFFCREVTQRARFFSPVAEEILDTLFSNIILFRRYDGKSVIREAGPGTENIEIYRARVAKTRDELDRILKNPDKELAAPPFKFAKHGRMNASGISVFYGGASADTCVAEVRPPVGSHVVIGRFQIVRNLRLLDFDVLSHVYANGSVFDPEFGQQAGQAAFLRNLVGELTMPVLPGEETFQYLPTQIVAEYLAEKMKPKLDGIIFPSTQDSEKGENIVLFQGCSRIEPYLLPKGTEISVSHGRGCDDDYDDSIVVRESVPTESPAPEKISTHEFWDESFDFFEKNNYTDGTSEITLRLDLDKDVQVRVISGAKYEYNNRYMSRYRTKKGDGVKEVSSFFPIIPE